MAHKLSALMIIFIFLLQFLPSSLQFSGPVLTRNTLYNPDGVDILRLPRPPGPEDRDSELRLSFLKKQVGSRPFYSHDRINRLKQALWDADGGYKIMSLILERLLTDQQLCRGISIRYNVTDLTVFAPRDSARFHHGISLEYQTFPMILTREDFNSAGNMISAGEQIMSCSHDQITVTHLLDDINGQTASIGSATDANVIDWDIYKDDHLVVHGVDSFLTRCSTRLDGDDRCSKHMSMGRA